MAKVVAEYGPFRTFRVKAGVLAVYRGERFVCNLRRADYGFACPERDLRERVRAMADAKVARADRVAYGRARKVAARVAAAASAGGEQLSFF